MSVMFFGDTISIKCYFKDKYENNIDPTDIVVTIYGYPEYEILETITDTTREEAGIYEAKYVFPDIKPINTKDYVIEWRGMYEGSPALSREKVTVRTTR